MANYLDPKNDLTFKRVFGQHNLWLRFLTDINEETKEVPKDLLENEFTREAVEYMKRAAYTKEELEAYDKWKIDILTERSAINDARQEGLTEGKIEGRGERDMEIAKKLKSRGMPFEQISEITDLTIEEIEKISQ